MTPSAGNPPPSAHIEEAKPVSGQAPLKVEARGHGHDDTRVTEHRWDFGDGSQPEVVAPGGPQSGSQVRHEYQDAGDYTLQLTVVDDQGAIGTHAQRIVVRPAGACQALGDQDLLDAPPTVDSEIPVRGQDLAGGAPET